MALGGCKFTWTSNPRNGFLTKEKIDRVIYNWHWKMQYPHATALALPAITSDHSPILVEPIPRTRSGQQFKYEAYWNDHDDCKKVVSQGWTGPPTNPDNWKDTIQRMKTCKRHLSSWQKTTFKAADREISKLKHR